jgi:hypothetical protein
VLFRIPLPLTIIQILAVDLGTDMLPALALGAERPDRSLMQQPPRPQGERLLSWPLLARAYLWLGPLQAMAAMTAFFFVLRRGGWEYGQVLDGLDPLYLQATTACLAAIVVAQVVNVFACRHTTESALRFGLRSNALLLVGVAGDRPDPVDRLHAARPGPVRDRAASGAGLAARRRARAGIRLARRIAQGPVPVRVGAALAAAGHCTVRSARSVAASNAAGPTGAPVARCIHRSGVSRPCRVIRSNSPPRSPLRRTCSLICSAIITPIG